MAVIINEFQVDVEQPAEQRRPTTEAAAPSPPAAAPLKPQDLRTIMRYQFERRLRLRAH